MTLPLLSIGAVGVVGTSTHFSGLGTKAMIEAYVAGDVADALAWHRRLLPIFTGIFATQGCILVKAGLELQGRGVGRRTVAAGRGHRGRDRRPAGLPRRRRTRR